MIFNFRRVQQLVAQEGHQRENQAKLYLNPITVLGINEPVYVKC